MSAGSARADGYDPLGNSPISNVPGSVSIFGGILTGDSSLGNLFIHPNDIDYENFGKGGFVGAAMSRQLVRFWSYFWLEAELGGGFRFEPGRDYYSPEHRPCTPMPTTRCHGCILTTGLRATIQALPTVSTARFHDRCTTDPRVRHLRPPLRRRAAAR